MSAATRGGKVPPWFYGFGSQRHGAEQAKRFSARLTKPIAVSISDMGKMCQGKITYTVSLLINWSHLISGILCPIQVWAETNKDETSLKYKQGHTTPYIIHSEKGILYWMRTAQIFFKKSVSSDSVTIKRQEGTREVKLWQKWEMTGSSCSEKPQTRIKKLLRVVNNGCCSKDW